ncbi:hypothetical protein HELRODRAFT_137635, partial [Helobdella robusta]|uniref:SH2 domain-containing protein n=1 Tax=Helobdella robusta TaxID=6412 RepID=T1EIM1_HELRO
VSRNKNDLEAPWFHGDISRDEINDLLMGTPDGTFIVRHSTTKDENEPYTLTLRKGGANKLIKICQKNGYWYLSASTQFASVYELIEHYTKHSLVHFNDSLDITLQYPL